MAFIRNCDLPEELYYLIEKHVWLRPAPPSDPVIIGINDVARHLAGTILVVTPKRAGRVVGKGQSVATLESAKWVGPVPAPVSGEIVEVNEVLKKNPAIINQDPYGEGWIVKLKPTAWEAEKMELATGPEGLERYQAFLEREGIWCGEPGG